MSIIGFSARRERIEQDSQSIPLVICSNQGESLHINEVALATPKEKKKL